MPDWIDTDQTCEVSGDLCRLVFRRTARGLEMAWRRERDGEYVRAKFSEEGECLTDLITLAPMEAAPLGPYRIDFSSAPAAPTGGRARED